MTGLEMGISPNSSQWEVKGVYEDLRERRHYFLEKSLVSLDMVVSENNTWKSQSLCGQPEGDADRNEDRTKRSTERWDRIPRYCKQSSTYLDILLHGKTTNFPIFKPRREFSIFPPAPKSCKQQNIPLSSLPLPLSFLDLVGTTCVLRIDPKMSGRLIPWTEQSTRDWGRVERIW